MSSYRDMSHIRVVATVGGGLIGSGWVAAFLGSGRHVQLHDLAPAATRLVRQHVREAWEQMVGLGLATAGDHWEARLSVHASLEEGVAGADFVQESTPERLDLKRRLFARLDALVPPDVLIASSTSSLPVSQLQEGLAHAGRFILGHPFNPVHLIPLIEVGGGNATTPEAIAVARDLYRSMGKEPIVLNREIFGHIGNRLTSAMFREAVRLVAEGYASVEDIDKAIRYGPALKWAIQGQFTTFHTSGGPEGLAGFLPKFASGIIQRWTTMADPPLKDPALQQRLVQQMNEATHGRSVAEIAARQDAALLALLSLLRTYRDD